MGSGGGFEHDYWRRAEPLSGGRDALSPGAIPADEFHLLAENIPTLCWIANGDGYIVWYNRRWHEYTGTTPEQMEGWGWQSVHDPDCLPAVMERWKSAVATGEPFEMTFPLRGADGVFRPFLTRIQPVRDAGGKVVRWFGVNTEIGAQVSAERERRENEERLRAIFDATPECIKIVAPDGTLMRMNHAGLCMVEADDGVDVEGACIFDVISPEDRAQWEENHRRVCAGESLNWDFDIIGLAGTRRRMETHAVPLRLPDGQTAQLAVTRDVSERKRTEEELRARSEQLEILNRTGAAIAAELDTGRVVQMVTDAGVELTGASFGAFFYHVVNDAGESMVLYTLSGADRSSFDGFGHPRPTDVFAPTFNGEGVIRSDDITADPRYGNNPPHHGMPTNHLPVKSYLAVPVISRSGDVIGGLFFGHPDAGVFTDQSESLLTGLAGQAAVALDNARLFEDREKARQLLEQRVQERTRELELASEALRQAQKMEAIGQLTGGIAHDFNNLLTVIRGSVDLLRRKELPDDKRRRYIDAISDTADRASKLTSQLLAFARRQALRPEIFDAAMRVHGIADMLRTIMGSRVRLVIDDDCNDCFVEADLGQFETALVNLAVNARDAMDGEGDLTIGVGRADEDGKDMVAIRVSDTGKGIPAGDLGRIFEPFFTTKEVGKGTGLGLSQVYGFIKQSDGDIAVESEIGRGTTFILTLPRAHVTSVEEVAVPEAGEHLHAGGAVLVVEDNADVGEFACQLLGDLGFVATLACTGEEALAKLEAGASDFDIVFSDVVMPGMGGLALGRIVREKWPHLPIVLTSGYSHVLAEESRHGFPLLHKPYSVQALGKSLREARKPKLRAGRRGERARATPA